MRHTSCEGLRLAIRAPQRSPNGVIPTPRRGRPSQQQRTLRPGFGRGAGLLGESPSQASEGHEVGGYGELGRGAARERDLVAVLEEIARKLREREGTAATD
jgi:hypothetical protein